MTGTFLGGSFGSWLGVRAYTGFGWGGIAGLTALASAAALTRHLLHRRPAAAAAPAAAGGPAGDSPAGPDHTATDRVSCP
jgi:hypothetical protein